MIRTAVVKVMWVGRATVFLVGLAVIVGLVFGAASVALGANGQPLILGRNNVATALTHLGGPAGVNGPMLRVANNNAGSGDTALDLKVQRGEAPMTVTSDTKVTNLNADTLDGQDATQLAEPQAYAHIADEGAVDGAYPSRGVNGVVIPTGQTSVYCFDLAFTPNAAVGSPFLTNSAVVATVTPPNANLTSVCPVTHRDAAAKTYGSSTGTDVPINFQILFF